MNERILEMKRDIAEYNLYELADGIEYGDYKLTVYNEGDVVSWVLEDNKGNAIGHMSKDEFMLLDANEIMSKFNATIFYSYMESESED